MSMDPNKWVNTIPFIGTKSNQEKYKLDFNRWVNTLPRKDDNTILKDNNTYYYVWFRIILQIVLTCKINVLKDFFKEL